MRYPIFLRWGLGKRGGKFLGRGKFLGVWDFEGKKGILGDCRVWEIWLVLRFLDASRQDFLDVGLNRRTGVLQS